MLQSVQRLGLVSGPELAPLLEPLWELALARLSVRGSAGLSALRLATELAPVSGLLSQALGQAVSGQA